MVWTSSWFKAIRRQPSVPRWRAFYARIPVGRVEAGLRTGDYTHPFPEEMNRVLTSRLTMMHFAATESAAENLRREGIRNEAIWVTGNPVIDAVQSTREALECGETSLPCVGLAKQAKRMILVTAHRRESFGPPLENICRALANLAKRSAFRSFIRCTQIHRYKSRHTGFCETKPT